MEIIHQPGERKGIFVATSEDATIGEMTYHMETAGVMALEHTEVKSEQRGNNVGLELLDSAADFARKNNIQIRPVCEFVKVMFHKHSDKYNDLKIK